MHADVAQLVAHHLAKVRVASSSLVIRSHFTGPIDEMYRAFSSAGERFPDTEEVTGSIPVSRTKRTNNLFNQCSCGCSAVGSASPCQGEGREFESRHPLNLKHLWVNAHRCFCVLPKKRFKGSKCSRWVDVWIEVIQAAGRDFRGPHFWGRWGSCES